MNTAILFDVSSIQHYVFGSNKLKDNVGASFIVENIYEVLIKPSSIEQKYLEIGYTGGGNALVFTDSAERAKGIINCFTTELLLKYPGISVEVAIKENFEKNNYKNEIKELFRILKSNKGKYNPVNSVSSHGITAICNYSSLPAVHIDSYGNLLSSATVTKRLYEEKAKKKEKELLNVEGLNSEYSFPEEFENLGQKKGEDSHIAVVHIDGNGFGKIFRELNLEETKNLSEKLKKDVSNSFTNTLISYKNIEKSIDNILDKHNIHCKVLPIRPIVLGGDDVTFVCHGKLGIWFAEKFMENFNKESFSYNDNKPFQYTSCAGVAVVNAKYPFFRAYRLAEDLCKSAKIQHKEKGGSWIDFQLAYSGLGNCLDDIRSIHYKNIKGANLHKRPFQVDAIKMGNIFSELRGKAFKLKQTLPNSKIKDLREMLTRDEVSVKNFIEHLKFQHNEGEFSFKNTFYHKSAEDKLDEHPFFDMIELLELYPEILLNK
ncbi:MAG: hypothetical protein CVU12_05665 [Bacteroidetes bacterium HGW-Bacteroidetes-7]|jgi:hypothetical protein|nr:MAG: hypothetical protein CVU12_05665 [Bacteroidetes bacterium HGW-Bacteroidetes-7]